MKEEERAASFQSEAHTHVYYLFTMSNHRRMDQYIILFFVSA